MRKMIARCGLDCEKCEAFIATERNDDALRAKVAREWSELNRVEITPDMINCENAVLRVPLSDKKVFGGEGIRLLRRMPRV